MGTLLARYSYDTFGLSQKVAGAGDLDLGFAGYLRHEATGLQLALYRAHDSRLGRWISADPLPDAIHLPEGPNLYAFAGNNPIRHRDELGLACGSGWSENVVPDKEGWIFHDFDFTKACEDHDKCYSTCGQSKAGCDKQFYNDMRKECSRIGVWSPAYGKCRAYAALYYSAVNKWGQRAYDAAQKQCGCK